MPNEVTANPMLGTMIFALGGLAGAVFYLPLKRVKNWAWESYWMFYAIFGLIVVPLVLARVTSPNFISVLKQAPAKEIGYCFLCGAMWGVGGLTWGLMIRYLGVGLGMAIGCGLCSAAGTLIPPIVKGNIHQLYGTPSANAALAAVFVSLLGIIMVGMAGIAKEQELPEEEKKKAVAEFNFKKGVCVATFSGIMSAAMSFGLQGGKEMEKLAVSVAPITSDTWRGIPVLVVVFFGGFVVNALWCLSLNFKNKTIGDYFNFKAPVLPNVFFAGAAGAIWCSQFVSFKTGEPAMGKNAFVGWAVLMAMGILFSTVVGFIIGEWKGTSARTRRRLAVGLILLIISAALPVVGKYLEMPK